MSETPPIGPDAEAPSWAQIEEWIAEEKYSAARDGALSYMASLDRDAQPTAWTRALVKAVQLELALHGYETAVRRLAAERWPEDATSRGALNLVYAHALRTYLSAYRWEVEKRERVVSDEAISRERPALKEWTLSQIVAEIHRAFESVWRERDEWGTDGLGALEEYVAPDGYPDGIRSTLRDAVTYLWVDVLSDSSLWRADEARTYRLSFPSLAAGSGSLEEGAHPLLRLSGLLADLADWHRDGGRSEAEFEARLELFRRLHGAADSESDRSAIRTALESELDRFDSRLPWWATGQVLLAEFVRQENEPDSLIRARELALAAAAAHPESVGGRRAAHVVASIEAPSYRLESMQVDGPGKRSVLVHHKNLERLWLRAYRLDLQSRATRSKDYNLLPRGREIETILRQSPTVEWTIDLPETADYREHQTFVVPPIDAPSLYLVVASADPGFRFGKRSRQSAATLIVSDLVLVGRSELGSAEISVREGADGRAAAGVQVSRYEFDYRKGHRKIQEIETGEDGIARFELEGSRRNSFYLVDRGEHVGLLRMGDRGRYRQTTDDQAVLYTDRSIYRPGQSVLWKVVAYRADPDVDDYRILADHELTVDLQDGNGETVASAAVTTNAFGSASGEFTIPNGRVLGSWGLQTSTGSWSSIRVEEYKRPTFEVLLEAPSEAARLNRPVGLEGSASYLFGAPLAGGEVRWRVERVPVYAAGIWRWPPPVAEGEIVAAGEGKVDASGVFLVEFTPEADERLSDSGVSYRYAVQAEVTDEGGETRSAQSSFRLGFVAIDARLTPSRTFYEASDPVEIRVERTDLAGTPRPGDGSWELVRLRGPERALLPSDLPRPVDSVSGEYEIPGDRLAPRWSRLRPTRAETSTWEEEEPLAQGAIEHGDDSERTLELGALAPAAYRVRYTSEDPFGARVEGAVDFFVVQETEPAPPVALFAEPAQTAVSVGDTARLALFSGVPEAELTVELFRNGSRFDRWTLEAQQGAHIVEIPVTETLRGGFSVRISTLSDYQFLQRDHSFFVPWSDRELSVAMASFRDRVQPGDRETWRVKVVGSGGELIEGGAEVLAFMYDRSLDLFAPHQPPSLAGVFPNRTGLGFLTVGLGSRGEVWSAEKDFHSIPGYPSLNAARIRFHPAYGVGGVGRRRMMAYGAPQSRMMASRVSADGVEQSAPAVAEVAEAVESEALMKDGSAAPPADSANAIRENFAETAFWEPHLVTDESGEVALEFTVPDSLTEWKLFLSALTENLSSGIGSEEVVSAKDLTVRPYLPRFVREGDSVVVRVLVRNDGEADLSGTFDFDVLDGESDESVANDFGLDREARAGLPIDIAAGEEIELSFPLLAPSRLGTFAVRAVATTDILTDGELRPLPVLPSRLHLAQSRFAMLRDEERRELSFPDLAADDDPTRIDEQMIVTLDGQLFYSVLHALPYLVDYPYECTEQTLNRFLSTGIVSGLYDKYPEVRSMAESAAARESQFEAWEADDPNRKMALEETPWLVTSRGGDRGIDSLINVLDPKRAEAERRSGLARLQELQTASGGFPWMPGGPPSPYMTMYLLTGFSRAIEFGIDVPKPMVQSAWSYMHRYYIDELVERSLEADCCWENVTFLNFLLSSYEAEWTGGQFDDRDRKRMLDFSFRHWKDHAPRLKLYLALTLARSGRDDDAQLVWQSIMDSAKTTQGEGTFWAAEDRSWLWYNDTIETHALALRAMLELDPDDERRHGLVQWLLLNKKLGQWKSTRATAEVIYALVHYLEAEGQLAVREQVDVVWGERQESFVFEPGEYTGARRRIQVEGDEVDPARDSVVVIDKETPGFLIASATWHFSTEELPTEASGDLLSVNRKYYRRVLRGEEWTLEPLEDGALAIGDQVEVHLSVRARHTAEYIHLRDPRPAGFEPETQVSRYKWQLGVGYYEEVRDSGTNFFFDRLPVGEYTLKYRLRATQEGTFRSGPATLQSMYAPEFTGYSAGQEISID